MKNGICKYLLISVMIGSAIVISVFRSPKTVGDIGSLHENACFKLEDYCGFEWDKVEIIYTPIDNPNFELTQIKEKISGFDDNQLGELIERHAIFLFYVNENPVHAVNLHYGKPEYGGSNLVFCETIPDLKNDLPRTYLCLERKEANFRVCRTDGWVFAVLER